jgi:hypothetical protein
MSSLPTPRPNEHNAGFVAPKSYWVWDMDARKSLPKWLLVWLLFLVVNCLFSAAFVTHSIPAGVVLGGFLLEHLIVAFNEVFQLFTMRYGIVSLLHLVCWGPGWLAVMADRQGRASGNSAYTIWSYTVIAVLAIAFIFDARDTFSYLQYMYSHAGEAHVVVPATAIIKSRKDNELSFAESDTMDR